MALLERQSALTVLRGALDRAGAGRGSLVLVTGEAGIGKTSLVHQVIADCGRGASVLEEAMAALLEAFRIQPRETR